MSDNKNNIDRRQFTKIMATIGATTLVPACAIKDEINLATTFNSNWHLQPDRAWIGAQYWANPLQDWEIKSGKLVCNNPAKNRCAHFSTGKWLISL